MKLDIVKRTFNYAVVNKPSGLICTPTGPNNIIDAVSEEFKQFLPNVNSSQFRIVQRLDRFVTGGLLIARNKKWADKVRRSFYGSGNLKLTRRYVGLIPLEKIPKTTNGIIEHEIEALEKDYRGKREQEHPRKILKYSAKTHYQLLPSLARTLEGNYPVFELGQVVPAIFQLETGRKNQIRDHVLQKFGVPLLNDDNFAEFKFNSEQHKNVNSTLFKNNQIGLHSGLLIIDNNEVSEEILFPMNDIRDRELWGTFIDENGEFINPIRNALLNFDH